ncbi:hypothetical protein [Halorientalis pallida]|uniref:Uncharacterized protein n=1 Tax=Halorientalis pallida TaxID=2479928 RepID=A0A498L0Y7_9EURY|nr:hypothetical protein [Halorientalis pallida]RXK50493.1 hypothetical protein EAF64_08075 [Halorientalis pallida]
MPIVDPEDLLGFDPDGRRCTVGFGVESWESCTANDASVGVGTDGGRVVLVGTRTALETDPEPRHGYTFDRLAFGPGV